MLAVPVKRATVSIVPVQTLKCQNLFFRNIRARLSVLTPFRRRVIIVQTVMDISHCQLIPGPPRRVSSKTPRRFHRPTAFLPRSEAGASIKHRHQWFGLCLPSASLHAPPLGFRGILIEVERQANRIVQRLG